MHELILDMDGVLVNTDDSYSQAAILAAKDLGARERKLQDVFHLRSQGDFNDDYDITLEFLREDGLEVDRQIVIDKFQSYYLGDAYQEGAWTGLIAQEPLLANPEFCAWLEQRGSFSVFTGRPKDEAFYVMKRLGLFEQMNHLVGMYDVVRKKPDPEGLLQIIKLQNYQNPLSCGDTLDDWRAAQAIGIDFVAILPPHPEARQTMENIFEKEHCPVILSSVNELPEYLNNKEAP